MYEVPNDMTDSPDGDPGASPYATGGGGVVLEHAYGATLLAALLAGTSIDLIGDAVLIDEVAFQARGQSPVDDFVVTGVVEGPHPVPREIAIAVRRQPTMAPSDKKFAQLARAMLQAVADNWDRAQAGTWRLGLVVAAPHTGARETSVLAELARSHPDATSFREAVNAPGTTNARVRQRLKHLEGVVRKILGEDASDADAEMRSWQMLFSLFVQAVELEGDVAATRTGCVARLQAVADSLAEAGDLFVRLTQLADRYGPRGARVDSAMLRRDLAGHVRVKGSLRYMTAWSNLDRLADRAKSRTRAHLDFGDRSLEVDRASLRSRLKTALLSAPEEFDGLIVTGEPDVGKSALTMATISELESEAAIALVNLRDLPTLTIELEHLIDASIVDVLAAMSVAPLRLLVVDGAEAVLEGWSTLLSDLAAASLRAGLLLVAVARQDAASSVSAVMTTQHRRGDPFVVPPFNLEERTQVAEGFESLARFSADPRSAWLLGRPGLVDLVLRADVASRLPNESLSEAHVFAAVWDGLVRRDEHHGLGDPNPDGREQALLSLARTAISGEASAITDLSALPSLRSDGLLLPAGPIAAWSTGEQFSSDLIRDFALARLLLVEGFGVLDTGDAPRWTMRAVLVALEAHLLGATNVATARNDLQAEVDAIAIVHGARWSDLIDEAVLRLGSAPAVLAAIWSDLVSANASGFARLVRLIHQRYTSIGIADIRVAGPVVDVYLAHLDEVEAWPEAEREAASDLVAAFMKGLAVRDDDDHDPTRILIRERTLAVSPHFGPTAVERLGLLGPDLDERADAALRGIAAEHPHVLSSIVESPVAVKSLALRRPDLLLFLTEAYYVEQPRAGGSPFAMVSFDFGIRRHTSLGPAHPFAAWWAGPFDWLLHVRPLETLALINRMLDHGANASVIRMAAFIGTGVSQLVELDLPGIGARELAGDDRAWSWYRGTTLGPNPCISALLAIERHADAWHTANLSLESVVGCLLKDCNNLAMVGLVIGFLVRHLDEVTTELDHFLVQPTIWALEFSRMTSEHGLFHAHRDDPSIHGFDYRRCGFSQVAGMLVAAAISNGDSDRREALEELANQLVVNATDASTQVDSAVLLWASALRPSSYEITMLEGGRLMLQARVPPEIELEHQAQQAEFTLASEAYRLLNTYAIPEDRRSSDVTHLDEDLRVARTISDNPPPQLGRSAGDALVVVAAAALIAHGDGRHLLSDDDIAWAGGYVIDAVSPGAGNEEYAGFLYSSAADRSAAASLPSLLLPAFSELHPSEGLGPESMEQVASALVRCAASAIDEVRRVLGVALRPVWESPCYDLLDGRCRHQIALEAVVHSLRDCRLGPWTNCGGRQIEPIEGDLVAGLQSVSGDDLLIDRLTGPIAALAQLMTSPETCVTATALALLEATLGAHQRGIVAECGRQYSIRDEGQVPVVTALVDLCRGDQVDYLDRQVRSLIDDPAALWQLLRLLAELATYDRERRGTIFEAWPGLMRTVFEEIEQGHDPRQTGTDKSDFRRADAVAALVLHPQMRLTDTDPNATMEEAESHWILLDSVRSEIEIWLELGKGMREALDDLVGYLRTLPPEQQVNPGLSWVKAIVAGESLRFANRTFRAASWLKDLRPFVAAAEDLHSFRELVDGLAAAGDSRFVSIQLADERGDFA